LNIFFLYIHRILGVGVSILMPKIVDVNCVTFLGPELTHRYR